MGLRGEGDPSSGLTTPELYNSGFDAARCCEGDLIGLMPMDAWTGLQAVERGGCFMWLPLACLVGVLDAVGSRMDAAGGLPDAPRSMLLLP